MLRLLLITLLFIIPVSVSEGQIGSDSDIKNLLGSESSNNVLPIEVHLTGASPSKGKYLVTPGTRVDDLLFKVSTSNKKEEWFEKQEYNLRDILIYRERQQDTLSSDLYSYNYGGLVSSNPILEDGDIVFLKSLDLSSSRISISGAVNTPLSAPYMNSDNVETLLSMAGGLSDYAETEHVMLFSPGGRLEKFSFDELDSINLKPNQHVVIPTADKVVQHYVEITGEVHNPGIYPIKDGETTLSDIIQLSGGPTTSARLNGIKIERATDKDMEVVPEKKDPSDLSSMENDGPVDLTPNRFTQTQVNRVVLPAVRLSDQYEEGRILLTQELKETEPTVYVSLTSSEDSVKLLHLDKISVPRDAKSVRLLGQVVNNGFLPWSPTKSVEDFIEEAGGLGPAADSNRIFVIKAGSYQWIPFEEATVESGDIIFVDRIPLETYADSRVADINEARLNIDKRNSIFQIVAATTSVIYSILLLLNR
jgi:protein involved in polysaccharide export with SLBB domain